MSEAKRLLGAMFDDRIKALNRLVFACEDLDTPEPPERPASLAWDSHPSDDDPDTLEEALALLEEWRSFASRLDDALAEAESDDGDHGNVLAEVREKAKAAREALIAIDLYDPPLPGSP